ncbi:MAG TPA: NADH-quinone oxidoreductase subunit C [Candidatus Omnitrophota bacterium]|nr:NADH-quinone oxidoreductase subunit C [Candidatus Omnitrophota bacterium]HRZ15407.1 NADH-quinone oxidoreductase subunit C [Candidatus Omnitrophota bacterium]
MDRTDVISTLKNKLPGVELLSVAQPYPDELRIKVEARHFKQTCLALHTFLPSPIMMQFGSDERAAAGCFTVTAVFVHIRSAQWVSVTVDIPPGAPGFDSLSTTIHSASLFEREIREMFGIEPRGNPDLRRLHLHDEVWPQGNFPLRKDFRQPQPGALSGYIFTRVEGDGIFEVPVGPVHAGIIGPGHFRFSVAGEPIINLELRLGFTHRGVEKLFEGKTCADAVRLSECVSGDSCFAHSLAFAQAAEKICGATIPAQAAYLRAIFLELERMYNHAGDIGGMALDVGFSFPAAHASLIKEAILQLNEQLTGSRYLKKVNAAGGVAADMAAAKRALLLATLKRLKTDFQELVKSLYASASFMDRVDTTGVLRRKTARDLGVVGLVGRAAGIPTDLRRVFPGVHREAQFKMALQESGDVLARLRVRVFEFEESCRLIETFVGKLADGQTTGVEPQLKAGSGLGYVEGWRGPVLYWLKIDSAGLIERCKIVDPSFHNWPGLAYAVLGNIIPDFPLCNKSFDLSYSGNDL